jgi:cell division ATPase FtsA
MPVRIGIPQEFQPFGDQVPDLLKSPIYSTGYGLLRYAAQASRQPTQQVEQGALISRVFKKMKSWIHDFL